jgi:hypothetical protein
MIAARRPRIIGLNLFNDLKVLANRSKKFPSRIAPFAEPYT